MTIIFQNLNTIKKEIYKYNYNYIIIIVIEFIAIRAVEVVTRDSGGRRWQGFIPPGGKEWGWVMAKEETD